MANGRPNWELIGTEAWAILRFPVQLLVVGAAILLLIYLFGEVRLPALQGIVTALSGTAGTVAFLLFLVGLAFAAFLWWLSARFFSLLTSEKLNPEQVAGLKDLPMALPEGTVRAVLALIVGVVGLPLLLFSQALTLSDAVAGYVNGIIIGVFSFYFGTRATGVPTQAMNQISAAQREAGRAQAEVDAARGEAGRAQAEVSAAQRDAAANAERADAATRSGSFAASLDRLQRHVGIASALVEMIGPALPSGMLPPALKTVLDSARGVLADVTQRGVTPDSATPSDVERVASAVSALIGGGAAGTSSIGGLLQIASKLLPASALTALGPVGAVATVLGVGWRLGSAEFQRWRARVLAAPYASGLVEFGTLTAEEALLKLDDAPMFKQAFAPVRNDPELGAFLADAVLRDDAVARIWDRYGNASNDDPDLFTDRDVLSRGLVEYRALILEDRARTDVDEAAVRSVTSTLADAQNPEVRPVAGATVTTDVVNAVIRAAGAAASAGNADPQAQAAFDALVTLVGAARAGKVDLPLALTELRP
ncbi:MAG: hypothetical protein AB7F35_26665 [Acetobacteraceae bacterium]